MKASLNMTTAKGPQDLESRVCRFIQSHRLVMPGQKLLVAVSGGPDSVCLLHVLSHLREGLGITLHIAHLNHRLRGADSEADAEYVAALAQRLGIPATLEERDVLDYQSEKRLSLEEAARDVRYNFLSRVAEDVGAASVAIGHTRDDHIETVLMHLLRGTGTRGLRGLQAVGQFVLGGQRLTVVRPLLETSRAETVDYCNEHGLSPRLDITNLALGPFRNRIRLKLLPLLHSYNPRITDALLRSARIAADDLALLDSEVAKVWDSVVQKKGGSVIISKAEFLALAPAVKRELLRKALERLVGNLKDIEARHIEAMLAALNRPAGRRIILPGGLTFAINYDRYLLGFDLAALAPLPLLDKEYPLDVPGVTDLPGWRVDASVITPEEPQQEDPFLAYFDFDKTGDQLVFRSHHPGDRFQPLGMAQPKKLNRFMIDSKIPVAWRGRVPIVCSPQQIIWVAGWRIDERTKITAKTSRILRLRMLRP